MRDLPENFLDSRDFARIARAIRFINQSFREQPRLGRVAAHVGLSEFHFNRLFRRWAGLTPKQYLGFVTGSAAREALGREESVLDAAYAVGLSGPGRLHDLAVTLDAMTPGEIKARGLGATIRYGFSPTPFGVGLFAATSRGLCSLTFVDAGGEATALDELSANWHRARLVRDDDETRAFAARIWETSGTRGALQVSIAGTNFQLKVWQALLELGAREHISYSAIAESIGAPGSTRAVGSAVGANPVGWLIPCHHVLRKSGALGGYRWGEDRKRAMLAWEALNRQPLPESAPPVRRAASVS